MAAERVIIRNDNLRRAARTASLPSRRGTGRAGDIRVAASEVTVIGGLIGSVPVIGDGGRITVEADHILLAGGATATGGIGAPSGCSSGSAGASGGATITAHEVADHRRGGQINADSSGGPRPVARSRSTSIEGAALTMQPGSRIAATAGGPGQGGGIAITGGDVLITGGAVLPRPSPAAMAGRSTSTPAGCCSTTASSAPTAARRRPAMPGR